MITPIFQTALLAFGLCMVVILIHENEGPPHLPEFAKPIVGTVFVFSIVVMIICALFWIWN